MEPTRTRSLSSWFIVYWMEWTRSSSTELAKADWIALLPVFGWPAWIKSFVKFVSFEKFLSILVLTLWSGL
ncbi:MAG: hypothetical protein AAF098_14120 [Pseudomonadota bacterium]